MKKILIGALALLLLLLCAWADKQQNAEKNEVGMEAGPSPEYISAFMQESRCIAESIGKTQSIMTGSTAEAGEWFDMWDWMINDHWQEEKLFGSHYVQHEISGHWLKLAKNMPGYPAEIFKLENFPAWGAGDNCINMYYESCWLGNDWSDPYTHRLWGGDNGSGKYMWLPRWVNDGSLFHTGMFRERHYHADAQCNVDPTPMVDVTTGFYCRVVLKQGWDWGGDIGVRDGIELNAYWPSAPYGQDELNKEVYYYVKEFGMVKWVRFENGNQTGEAVFNQRVPSPITVFTPCWQKATVVYPNGGELWARGRTYRIHKIPNYDNNVKIELLKGGAVNTTITASTPGDLGYYDWPIPSTQATGGDYQIRVTNISNGTTDSSNANFTIGGVPGNPALRTPGDGATVNDTTPTFKWYAVGTTPVVDYYQLQINNDDGTVRYVSPNITGLTFTLPAANRLQSGKSYGWYVRAHNSLDFGGWSGRTITIGNIFQPPVPPSGCGTISAGYGLGKGQQFYSCDGRFLLAMQNDGNLVLYQNGGGALWASGTGSTAFGVYMQEDGNLVIYNQQGVAMWASNTGGHPGAFLAIQNDGNMVIYYQGAAIWATNTGGR